MPRSGTAIPQNWPSKLVYLTRPYYTPNVSSSLLTRPEAASPSSAAPSAPSARSAELPIVSASEARSPCANVRIALISDPSHPAHGQSGLFSTRHLPPDSFIVCYLGRTHTDEEADPQSSYDLALDRELGIAVDATEMGNEARFINDYRGVRSEGPNAEFRDISVRVGKGLLERRVGVFVKPESKARVKGKDSGKGKKAPSGIAKGEEILVSYGKGFWTHFLSPEGAGESLPD